LATGVAVYFDSKLRKLKSKTYQRHGISPAKVREKILEIHQKKLRPIGESLILFYANSLSSAVIKAGLETEG